MSLEKPNINNKESLETRDNKEDIVEDENTVLVQEPKAWEPFDDENIGEDFKRLPASPEQIEKMDETLEELGDLFDGFDKWHLDGALNISLLKEEYIGSHKDVDISVERNDLDDLEKFLEKKGYGLFLSQDEKDGDDRQRVMRRVSSVGMENYDGHPMICALGEEGKIDNSKNLNYVDLHVVDRDTNNEPLLDSGVKCPEKWTKAYPVNKENQKINLSHPAKVLYYKLNQGRNYDSTDVDRLLELGAVKEVDIDEINNIFDEEFIKKKESIYSLCDTISQKITPEMESEEIFKEIKALDEFKDKDQMDESLQNFSNELHNLKEKSAENVYNLAMTLFNVEEKNQEKINGLEQIKQTISDREKLKDIRNEINKQERQID